MLSETTDGFTKEFNTWLSNRYHVLSDLMPVTPIVEAKAVYDMFSTGLIFGFMLAPVIILDGKSLLASHKKFKSKSDIEEFVLYPIDARFILLDYWYDPKEDEYTIRYSKEDNFFKGV